MVSLSSLLLLQVNAENEARYYGERWEDTVAAGESRLELVNRGRRMYYGTMTYTNRELSDIEAMAYALSCDQKLRNAFGTDEEMLEDEPASAWEVMIAAL